MTPYSCGGTLTNPNPNSNLIYPAVTPYSCGGTFTNANATEGVFQTPNYPTALEGNYTECVFTVTAGQPDLVVRVTLDQQVSGITENIRVSCAQSGMSH